MLNIFNETFIVFDLETTGLYPEKGARVCEIGALRYEKGRQSETFSQLIYPQMSMPPEASRVNGIYDIDLAGVPVFSEIAEDFLAFIGDSPVFGYKIGFDMGFVNNELEIMAGEPLKNKAYDVLLLAKEVVKGLPGYSLSSVAGYFDINTGTSHRAFDDAKTTAEVFKRLLEIQNYQSQRFNNIEDLYELCGYPRKKVINTDFYNKIQEKIQKGLLIELEYRSGKGEVTRRQVQPLRLESRGTEEVLIGKCILRNDMRSFNLSRIIRCV